MDSPEPPGGDGAFPLSWPTFPFPASVAAWAVLLGAVGLLAASRYLYPTQGVLTVSLTILAAFTAILFTGILYGVPQTALNEIMVGALATALGAVISFWMSRGGK